MRPDDRRYRETHEWVKPEGEAKEGAIITVGISDFAVEQLTDLTFVDLPDVGDSFSQGEVFGEIESVKAVSNLYAPVSGEIVEVHEELDDEIDLVGKDPYEKGWLVKFSMRDPEDWERCMTVADYEKHIESESH